MAKVKKAPKSAPTLEDRVLEPSETKQVKLVDIVSNKAQSRGMGVLVKLQDLGYGLFTALDEESEKRPLWELLFSDKTEDRKFAVALIEDNEPELVKAAKSQKSSGQIQPIGVRRLDSGELDVIYGIRRAIARAYNLAKYGDDAPDDVRANIYDQEFTNIELRLFAYEENDNRLNESPMDRALFFRDLTKTGMEAPEIGKRVGLTGQAVRDYIKLLHKKLEDKWPDIHSGELGLYPALDLLKRRLEGKGARDKNGDGRDRLPGAKALMKLYDSKVKPSKMDDEEWELWIKPDVRRLLSYKFHLPFSEWTPPAKEEKKKADANGAADNVVKIKKARAINLLICLGKTDARTWDNAKIKKALENVVNIGEKDQKIEKEALQKVYDRLYAGYANGIKVEILPDEKK